MDTRAYTGDDDRCADAPLDEPAPGEEDVACADCGRVFLWVPEDGEAPRHCPVCDERTMTATERLWGRDGEAA